MLVLDSKEPILSGSKSCYQKAVELLEPLFPKILCALGLLLATMGVFKLFSSQFNLDDKMGAVLAGVFTGSAAFFTLANLVYNSQKDRERAEEMRLEKERQIEKDQEQTQFILDQSKLISRQLELSELEQYTKHRELFNERLNHIEKKFGHKFEFADPYQLYKAAFPHNQIGQTNIRYNIELNSKTPTDLENAVNKYQSLANSVKTYHSLSPSELSDFPLSLLRLHDRLQIHYDQQTKIPGDIFFRGQRTGINCFNMREAVQEITYVLNELLDFTGNAPINTFEHNADASWTKEGLLKYFLSSQPHKIFHMHDPLGAIAALHNVRIYSETLQSHPDYADIHMIWFNLIDSKEKIEELADKDACKELGEYIQNKAFGFNYSSQSKLNHHQEVLKAAEYLIGLN